MQKVVKLLRVSEFLKIKASRFCLATILMLSLLSVRLYAQDVLSTKKIDLNLKDVTLRSALMSVQKQSGLNFAFSQDFEKHSNLKVSISQKAITVKSAIETLLKGTNLRYVLTDDQIVIDEKPASKSPNASAGQGPGTLKGRIVEFESSQPLPGASVYIVELQKGMQSNNEGYYKFANVPAGKYTLKVTYISYTTETVQVEVKADKEETFDVKMRGSNALSEVVVSSVRKTRAPVAHTSDRQMVAELKAAQSVVSGISAEQISKSADRNAAEVVRRIAGVTVRDDKFIIIRGMNERYNLTYLNGNVAPSTEQYSRAFSLDLIPSRIIDKILVYKSPAPDLLADMTGGAVKIVTKDAKNIKHFDIELQLGARPNTTFKNNFLTYKGSGTDFLGFDNGLRKLPASVPRYGDFTKAAISQNAYAETFSPVLQYGFKTALPLMQLTGNYYNTVKIGSRNLSILSSLSYKNESQQYDVNRTQSFYDADLMNRTHQLTDQTQSTQTAQLTLLQNFTYQLRDSSTLQFKNFILQQGRSSTIESTTLNDQRYGFFTDAPDKLIWTAVPDNYRFTQDRNIILAYTQNFLYLGNLGGSHYFGKGHKQNLEWNAGYTHSLLTIPDQRVIRLQRNRRDYQDILAGLPGDAAREWLAAVRPTSALQSGNNGLERGILSRTWSRNLEKVYNGSADYTYKIKPWVTLKMGMYHQWKERTLFRRVYTLNEGDLGNTGYPDYGSIGGNGKYIDYTKVFFSEQDLNKVWSSDYLKDDGSALKVFDRTSGSDAYMATEQNNSGYAAFSLLPYNGKLDIYGGLRVEYNRQKVAGAIPQSLNSAIIVGGVNYPIMVDNKTTSFLPSLNVGYRPNDQWVIRAAYGKTVNRPEFRELSPYTELDYTNNQNVTGNNALKSAAINNYDLRFEWYPGKSKTSLVSIGGFYKQLNTPIERMIYRDLNLSAPATISYANADRATIKGVEIDIRQTLDFIPLNFFRNISIAANGSVIKSEAIKIRNPQLSTNGDPILDAGIKRQLQGQAPYSANIGLYYDNAGSGTKVAVIYNQVGPRIYAAATGISIDSLSEGNIKYSNGGSVGSLIELTRRQLDFSLTQRIVKSLQFKFSVQNLLNQSIRMAEDENFTYKYEKAEFIRPAPSPGAVFNAYKFKGDLIANEYKSDRLFVLSFNYSF